MAQRKRILISEPPAGEGTGFTLQRALGILRGEGVRDSGVGPVFGARAVIAAIFLEREEDRARAIELLIAAGIKAE